MTNPIRIAIAGAGQMGVAHAEAFRACGAKIVAVLDRDHERARRLAAESGARACGTIKELLSEIPDALSICLPHSLHFEVAMQAAEKRVALLVEKPHCVTLEESRALRAACSRYGVLAMAGFTHRFLATSQKLKAQIKAGRLGRIDLAVDRLIAGPLGANTPVWYRERALAGGGIAMIGMIHSVDRLRWLLDSEIVSVTALTRQSEPAEDVENTALALLEFANGAQAALVAHRSPVSGHQRAHDYELFGKNLNAYCTVGSFDHQQLRFVGADESGCETVTADRPFVTEIREFTSALIAGRSVSPDLHDAEIALGAVLAIYESGKTRQPINLAQFLGNHSAKPQP